MASDKEEYHSSDKIKKIARQQMRFQNLNIKHVPSVFGSQLADLSLLKSYLSQRRERRRMARRGKRSQASTLTWASNYTKWTLEREESVERELALDWIRSQGGEKHGRHGEGEGEDAFYSPFNLL